MLGSQILDVVIGMVFVFTLLSLVCSAVNEMIEAWVKRRARDLEAGLRELLDDPEGAALVEKIYCHPLVFGLFRGTYDRKKIRGGIYREGSNLPSYIPSRNFALALMDVVAPAAERGAGGAYTGAEGGPVADRSPLLPTEKSPYSSVAEGIPLLPAFRESATKIANSKVRDALLSLIDTAGDDVEKARRNIEEWYDSAMERVAGWYKRRVQTIIFFIGLAASVILNADTIAMLNSLSYDSELAGRTAVEAQAYLDSRKQISQYEKPAAKQDSQNSSEEKSAGETGDAAEKPLHPLTDSQKALHEQEILTEKLQRLRQHGIPIGWNFKDTGVADLNAVEWIIKIIGWLLTAFAVSMGAPFWFDLLNKFASLRSTVRPKGNGAEGKK